MHDSWKEKLVSLRELALNATRLAAHDKRVQFPPLEKRYAAFDLPFDKVKVVMLGQDPYYCPNQANGLAFSVNKDVPLTVSLKVMYEELWNDLKIVPAVHGDLRSWVDQGVLLLNSALTVAAYNPGGHLHYWEPFTDGVIKLLSDEKDHLVFILWGTYAAKKVKLIDLSKHVIIKATHPASRDWVYEGTKDLPAFSGSKSFSKCNEYLVSFNKEPIKWSLN